MPTQDLDVDFGLRDDVSDLQYYHSMGLDGARAKVRAEEGALLLPSKIRESVHRSSPLVRGFVEEKQPVGLAQAGCASDR